MPVASVVKESTGLWVCLPHGTRFTLRLEARRCPLQRESRAAPLCTRDGDTHKTPRSLKLSETPPSEVQFIQHIVT